MIAIIDYGMGNLRSVQKCFERMGHEAVVTSDPQAILNASMVVLPGVGAFPDCMLLLNEEPVNVTAFGGDYLNKGIYDTTMTTIEFRNGVKGHIFVNWLHPYKEQKLIVIGSKAMVVFDNVSNEKLFLYPHKIEWIEGKVPVATKADYQVITFEKAEPLKGRVKAFYRLRKKQDAAKD